MMIFTSGHEVILSGPGLVNYNGDWEMNAESILHCAPTSSRSSRLLRKVRGTRNELNKRQIHHRLSRSDNPTGVHHHSTRRIRPFIRVFSQDNGKDRVIIQSDKDRMVSYQLRRSSRAWENCLQSKFYICRVAFCSVSIYCSETHLPWKAHIKMFEFSAQSCWWRILKVNCRCMESKDKANRWCDEIYPL